ncbi:MAG TPA: class I SAM-dependent methyltransferase [Candidatus Limnocylindrales bacterium]
MPAPGSAGPPPIDAEAFNAFEAAGWEARADSYAFLRPLTGRIVGSLLASACVAAGDEVLDVGTGPGDLAAAAAALGADTVGIDVAPSMVRRAALAHPSIPFRVGSFEAIPAGEGTFDAVMGNFVFNHVGRPEVALGEAMRVLRPGGWLALSSWDSPQRNRVLGLVLDAVAAAGAPPPPGLPAGPTNFRTDDELQALFAVAGFVDVGLGRVMFEAMVPDLDTLWRGVLDSAVRIPPLVMAQAPDVQVRIREAFDRLAEVHRRPDGRYAIPVSVQVTRGRRP